MKLEDLEARLRRARIVPVIRADTAPEAEEQVERLLAAGLEVIELTTTIPAWPSLAEAITSSYSEVALGIGTIGDPRQASQAAAVGADFCVSPRLVPDARLVLQESGIPFIEGGLTPTEVLDAASRGIAKLFPAHVGGVRYMASLLAVAPTARIMPTGGIPLAEVSRWLDAGAIAVGVGSDLAAPGDVTARVQQAVAR
jgi:2-dehydro-3-deoxyphosphogluconate aldolase/(4S)-4-hydroxy-2-oxoglutarate aldolase